VLVGGAFWGGTVYQKGRGPAGLAVAGTGQGLRGGPMADLTEEEQAELAGMTDEERQAFMQERFGAQGAAGGMGGPARGGNLEGEVIEITDDTITMSVGDSGSQTLYTDDDTIIAYVEGAATLGAGSQVMVIAQPTTDGVTTASLVVVE
jgi:hypothetical protein